MKRKQFYPTCRICDKLSADMTHCLIYGQLNPAQIDDKQAAATCTTNGDYIRYLHATPNHHNYAALDEREEFENKFGITLEGWIQQTFGKESKIEVKSSDDLPKQ
ncbi:hypothetical protein [Paenibacillus polymyxa]|uniref:hypothetical protein n=1 Tax=Paenibacillus polymyxa TaxID=1406 RepID=UPI00058A4F5E|nr:hypothetical protein [Paenibacillus polymyxa]AJE54277.1 hypothetical protein RE92_25150 [Paenibacillus polymyxa]